MAHNTLKEKIIYLESLMNTVRIIESEQGKPSKVRRYFRINRFAYKKFHSDKGFMHFRISSGDKLQKNDIYYQPDVVSSCLKSGMKALELGPGRGSNMVYLAEKHPDVSFTGFDLLVPKIKDQPKNMKIVKQDYSDLSAYGESTFDVVFAVETIVHCPDKEAVFRSVRRVLKPGGLFVLYDYALPKEYEEYDEIGQKTIALISKGGASPLIISDARWSALFAENGLKVEKENDLSKNVLPDLNRLRKTACRVIEHPRRVKVVFHTLPALFVNNIVAGYLGYDACLEDVIRYKEWICRLDK